MVFIKMLKLNMISNNFDINGIHKNTKISFSGNINKEKLLKKTLWLKNRYNFLKSYIKLLGEKNLTETVNNKVISLKIFEKFMNDIANGNINNYNIKKEYDKIFNDIEKDLAKSKIVKMLIN